MIFDGRALARELETELAEQVSKLAKRPKIVSVVVGEDQASALYSRLKQKAAERVGIGFDVVKLDLGITDYELGKEIAKIGLREEVGGVMVQLPIPGLQGQSLKEVLSVIPLAKDVDGLRWGESGVKPATVKAILTILDKIAGNLGVKIADLGIVVLGARGAVGRPLVHYLRERGAKVSEIEWDTPNPAEIVRQGDVVISCVGKAGIVQETMVKDGVVAIDVGMSEVAGKVVGDMTSEVYQKAAVAVPVPGGVGPVTIVSLLNNTLEIINNEARLANVGKFAEGKNS